MDVDLTISSMNSPGIIIKPQSFNYIKLSISLLTIIFDSIFVVQNYFIYPQNKTINTDMSEPLLKKEQRLMIEEGELS